LRSVTNSKKDMENRKNSNQGFLAMLMGIAAGFIFIIAAFVGFMGELDSTGVLYIAVGICLIACFIPMYNVGNNKKSCTKNIEKV
jgi:uncharacterized membrane protein YuzA (DUF378 family)